jgi:predicted Rossmann fold flavoprotein
MYSALNFFSPSDTMEFFESRGLSLKTERGRRVFPTSDKSLDVVKLLDFYSDKSVYKTICEKVLEIKECEDGYTLRDSRKTRKFRAVIVATGGISYPQTGSDGYGYKLAAKAGHTIVEPKPSLVPLCCEEAFCKDLMGLSLKNVEVNAYNQKGKKIHSGFGEMLFTHFGVSGPLILSLSAHIKDEVKNGGCKIKIDLKPALSEQQLDGRILRDFDKQKNKHLINSLDALLPKALIPVIIEISGIQAHKSVCEITKAERKALCYNIKALELNISGFRPIAEAIITSGGVKTSEINSSTMESKLVKGLYFAGEIIDVDAYTGGYNLQAAWSTGYLAGMNAAVEK